MGTNTVSQSMFKTPYNTVHLARFNDIVFFNANAQQRTSEPKSLRIRTRASTTVIVILSIPKADPGNTMTLTVAPSIPKAAKITRYEPKEGAKARTSETAATAGSKPA